MTAQIGGLTSTMIVSQIISQLADHARTPAENSGPSLGRTRESEQELNRISQFGVAMNALAQQVEKLAEPAKHLSRVANVSAEKVLGVRITGKAELKSYAVEILQRAESAHQRSRSFSGESVRAGRLEISVFGERSASVEISAGATLEGVGDQINQAGLAVRASILRTGSEKYLNLVAARSGAPQSGAAEGAEARALVVEEFSTGRFGQGLGFSTVREGQNARLVINGEIIERSSNTINVVIEGVELSLLQQQSEIIEVEIAPDPAQVLENLEKLTEQYNATVKLIQEMSGRSLREIMLAQLHAHFDEKLSELGFGPP